VLSNPLPSPSRPLLACADGGLPHLTLKRFPSITNLLNVSFAARSAASRCVNCTKAHDCFGTTVTERISPY